MSSSDTNTSAAEQEILALQGDVALLQRKNEDLQERLKAHSSINVGQVSLINKLIDKVPFGVIFVNDEHCILHANEAAEKIFLMSSSELDGLNCNDFFDAQDFHQADSCDKQITLMKNGKYVLHSSFISNEGSHNIIVKSLYDISEIKIAEQELLKINQAKDEFLGMISHELRSPLNVIQGYSSLLEEELKNSDSPDAISYLQHINQSGDKLLQVVVNVLEISDLSAGKIKPDYIHIDLDLIVSQLQFRLEKEYEIEENSLIFKYEDIPPFQQDLVLLMKVLCELLINANKFTEKGEVVVSISLQQKESKDWLAFEVADTGRGMTQETISQIFDAFHQADSSVSRAHEGLGLGLSLVEKIVKVIHGEIQVESEIGVGTTFVVWVPFIV